MSSICEQATGIDSNQFWGELNAKITYRRIPFVGSLALTHHCNLNCVHCYAKEDPDQKQAELATGEWIRIIDEVREAGCLNLLLTGGEPLLRRDFADIYSHAKKSGFLVTVFSNGTLLDDRAVGLFRELPPRMVELSLYGSHAGVHDRITGVAGSFDQARRGIQALLSAKIPLRLKTILMKWNEADFHAIRELAERLGVEFRFDPAIFPTLAGGCAPMQQRVAPERAVELELQEPRRIEEWREFLGRFKNAPAWNNLYNCGAGLITFHVDPFGRLSPCIMTRNVKYSLLEGDFRSGWDNAFSAFREQLAPTGMKCNDCQSKLACGYCPGFFEMESGSERIPSDYLCCIGKARYDRISMR